MKHFNYYLINEKYYKVLSIRIFQHTFRILIKRLNQKWTFDFNHMKLEQLNIIPLYYEVGFIKYKNENSTVTK